MKTFTPALHERQTPMASVTALAQGCWRLLIQPGQAHQYRLAQLDDHGEHGRRDFNCQPPLSLRLQARVSSQDIPGTWGFGFWNEPFGFLLGIGANHSYMPSLPQTAWFFHASHQNYLSFRDDLPANGYLAATFSSKSLPGILIALASPVLGLTLLPATSQYVRRLLGKVVLQSTALVEIDVTEWHTYQLDWKLGGVTFSLDSTAFFETQVSPQAPLSLVIWIDNQYAALAPTDRVRFGYLANSEPAWLDIRQIELLKLD